MKFEIKKQIVTPDGEVHDSREAAKAHMWARNLDILASAARSDLEAAIDAATEDEGEMQPDVVELRHAIREVYLAAWPRASKGHPRKPKEAASEAPALNGEPSDEPSHGEALTADDALMGERHDDEPGESRGENLDGSGEPEAAPKRSHGKKKAA